MTTTLFRVSVLVLVGLLGSRLAEAQRLARPTTFCNPLNLAYRFQLNVPSRREAADPVIVLFKGTYYLFASKSGGYWSSSDLIDWTFITTKDLPLEDYAPAAVVIEDSVYFMALDKRIYSSANPATGSWKIIKNAFPLFAGDPDLFLDDNQKLYLYYGLSNSKPIYGIELNRKTFEPLGQPVECFNTNSVEHGWERRGDYNTDLGRPYLEGAWMTKHAGKYYLQYSAPGTQFKSYADGLYTADAPLGPFKLADTNPFSYKPEGFMAGAGHGSTFQDKWGNYWHAATMTISVKEKFERRLGLFPAFFDKDGGFYTYTAFGDFPHAVPQRKLRGPEDYQPSAMLLSYRKPVEASSTLPEHPASNVTAENGRTYWSAATGRPGEWVLVDLQRTYQVKAVQLNFAEESSTLLGRPEVSYFQYRLECSTDKENWRTLADKTAAKTDAPHDYVELAVPASARYVRLTNYHVPDGKFAVSGLRIFGSGRGPAPPAVTTFSATRDTADARNVALHWPRTKDAVGYTIRYGTAPDKLYLSYQVLDADSLTIHSLNRKQNYYFAIDSFNENGWQKGEKILLVPAPSDAR